MRTLSLFGFVAITLLAAGCAKDEGLDANAPANTTTGIEIEGTWGSSFGGTETISDDAWASGDFVTIIADYSNSENVAVTLNSDDAEFNPGKYNRIVWTEIADGSFHYCTTDFGLETLEDAQAASTVPDASDPDNSGCGGFSWTKLTRE
jgi:hypothetical protein